jgi:CHAT domain-containing protein
VLHLVLLVSLSAGLASCATQAPRDLSSLEPKTPVEQMDTKQCRQAVTKLSKVAPKYYESGDIPGYIHCMELCVQYFDQGLGGTGGTEFSQCAFNRSVALKYLAQAQLSIGNRLEFEKDIDRALEGLRNLPKTAKGRYSMEARLEFAELYLLKNRVSEAAKMLEGFDEDFAWLDDNWKKGDDARAASDFQLEERLDAERWRVLGTSSTFNDVKEAYEGLSCEVQFRSGDYAGVCRGTKWNGAKAADAVGDAYIKTLAVAVSPLFIVPNALDYLTSKAGDDSTWSIQRSDVGDKAYTEGFAWLNAPGHLINPSKDIVPHLGNVQFVQKLTKRWYIAMSAYELKDTALARKTFEEILSSEGTLARTDPMIWWSCHYYLGNLLAGEGKFQEALAHYAKAIDIIENLRNSLLTDQLKLGFSENKNLPYDGAVRTSLALNDTDAAFVYSERARSRALLDLLENRETGRIVEASAAPAADKPAAGASEGMTALPLERLTKSMFETRAIPAATGATPSKEAELNSILGAECLTAQDVQGFLGSDDSLVEYFVGETQLVIFVVNKDGVTTETVKTGAPEIQEAVEAFRGDILSGSPAFKASSQRLYKMIYAPVEARVRANAVFVPHLQLHKVPFAALMDGDGRYLVESKAVSTVYSGSTLKYLAGKGGKSLNRILALANPAQSIAPMLPSTEQEVAAIGPLFTERNILVGSQATKAALLSNAKGYDVIHLACHGKFYPENPSQSCLLLAGNNEDGMLRASDIYQTDITGCSLVTLSACETGLSKETTGDDALGLGRALIYAGAPRIVVSLWSVADAATADLMVQFYGALKKGETAPQALRTAQLAMLHRTGETAVNRGIAGVQQNAAAPAPAPGAATTIPYGHPFFWAPFVVMGEWK